MRELLEAKGAAAYLHLASQTMAKMRLSVMGPAYYKAGRRVLYDRTDLDRWLDSKRRLSSDPAANASSFHRSELGLCAYCSSKTTST